MQGPGPSDLDEAVATASRGVVLGKVVKQDIYEGFVISTVVVEERVSGTAGATVDVAQVGGPVFDQGQPLAAQLSNDPLLLLGESYLPKGYAEAPTTNLACTPGLGRQFAIGDDGLLTARVPDGTQDHWSQAYDRVSLQDLKREIALAAARP